MDEQREDIRIENKQRGTAAGVAPLLLTIPQAAAVLAVGRTTVYELIGAGDLEAVNREHRPVGPCPGRRAPGVRRPTAGVAVTDYRHRRAQRLVALAAVPTFDIAEEVSSSGVH